MNIPRAITLSCALMTSLVGAPSAADYVDSEVVRIGDPAPGTGGGTFARLEASRVDDAGDVAFFARAETGGSEPMGLFVREGDLIRKLIFKGDPVSPSLGSTVLQNVLSELVPAVNANGDCAFFGEQFNPFNRGVYRGGVSGITAVALVGDPAPAPLTGTYVFVGQGGMDLNDAGELVFAGRIGSPTRDVLLRELGGTVSVIAVQGDPAPGGGDYTGFGGPTINAAGDVAFSAITSTGSIVVLVTDGVSQLVASRDDVAPGTGGAAFAGFNHRVVVDDLGGVAFRASTTAPDAGEGIFRYSAGLVSAVAISGDTAPGIPGGTLSFVLSSPFSSRSGRVVFQALVDLPSGSQLALFAESDDGSLELVRREGDSAPAGSTYSAFEAQSTINSNGLVSFTSTLADGAKAVFVSEPVPVVAAIQGAGKLVAVAAFLIAGVLASVKLRGAQC